MVPILSRWNFAQPHGTDSQLITEIENVQTWWAAHHGGKFTSVSNSQLEVVF